MEAGSLQKLKTVENHSSNKPGQYKMASLERDLAAVDRRQCQQFLHEEILVCNMTLVSKDTEDNVHASIYRQTAAPQSTKNLTYMLLSCLVSNYIGFMQKSSLCYVPQSCKAPGKCKAVSQYLGFVAHFWSKIRKSETRQQTQLLGRGGVALLQEKHFAKTCAQMCFLALLQGRIREHDQGSCFTSPGFSYASSLFMPVSSLSPCYTQLWAAINNNLCYRQRSSHPWFWHYQLG